jgi:hypothetical protein
LFRDARSAKKIPGVRKYEVSKGPITTPAGPSGLHLVAILHSIRETYDRRSARRAHFGTMSA